MNKVLWIAGYILLAPFIGGFLDGLDRKLTARLQGRKGPPLLQPFYDILKLFSKEAVVVNEVQNFLVWGYLIFTVFTGSLFFSGGDILLSFFALTLAEIFLVMSAFSANSPYSQMGSQRELMQMMAYEPMVLLSAIGFYVVTDSFAVGDIVSYPIPPIAYMPGIFIGFIYLLTIKFRKSPFDLSTSHHAHQEMVKGLTTEISGNMLGLVELAHWYETVFLLGVVALFVLTGAWWSWIVAVAVCLLCYFLEIFFDNTFPRVKWQLMLGSTWIVTLIVGVINLMILMLVK
ncbi:respiratory chain complex I subunit 1 family protein [Gehongia tenuis]|uniref:NADH-quinone oxidoreductase subunit H n=1 Tax=Gehongia tenuis TaxID=2763655 RepID=A0A926HQP9_9FIRM|nr:complex I subunit 1 family protein [Gehongia tenuis]MBC8531471.1 NADH-quinone oxidoreductase subunit H [Gehongia tenuis]